MRRDMKDLIVNTGRHGGGGKAAQSRRARFNRARAWELPKRISSSRRRQFGWDGKELGDRIAPLRGYLEAQVGRPWDDVYSEICEHADSRTIRGYHLRQHVWSEVQIRPDPDPDSWRNLSRGLYVDDGGILRFYPGESDAEREARYAAHRAANPGMWPPPRNPRVTVDADHWYERIEGYWFEFTTAHIKDSYPNESLVDRGDGVVEIENHPREFTRHETTKRQVDAKTQSRLDERLKEAA